MKLLIVEDSDRLRNSLKQGLSRLGYAVDAVGDGRKALQYISVSEYDVIILDIMLPEVDGLSVLRQIRAQRNNTHVLILSARDQVKDRITGLEIGADDYLVKPFSFDELCARVCALVRRAHDSKNPVISIGEFQFNTALKELKFKGTSINLTPNELSLLEYLLLNRGRVIRYEQLELKLYNADSIVSRNAIEAHVSALRKKLKQYETTELIKTRRGFGYYIDK